MHFDEALQYLLSLGHETLAIKLGLRNTELLLDVLGNPQKSYFSVQIAGTNGKGSTAVVLESICRAAGIKTGIYTSPHLISITERVKINGRDIRRNRFAENASRVRDAAEKLLAEGKIDALPTFFEQVTAISLLAFKDACAQLAIFETGLGGRLDATTTARAGLIGITPIALDHQEYLGDTLAAIAAEKAAIVRPGATVIVAPQEPEALEVILQKAESSKVVPSVDECRTTVENASSDGKLRVTFRTKLNTYQDVELGLRGRHQITNVSVAIRLAESLQLRGFFIDQRAIIRGIENARHAGRLELWHGKPSFLFDGAHNPAGATALRKYLDEFVQGPITLLFGAMRDKNLTEMAEILFPAATSVVLTRPDNPRAAEAEILLGETAGILPPERVHTTSSVAKGIQLAKKLTPSDGTICICGSLYLIGETQAMMNRGTSGTHPN